jgi:hypothetical protein
VETKRTRQEKQKNWENGKKIREQNERKNRDER